MVFVMQIKAISVENVFFLISNRTAGSEHRLMISAKPPQNERKCKSSFENKSAEFCRIHYKKN